MSKKFKAYSFEVSADARTVAAFKSVHNDKTQSDLDSWYIIAAFLDASQKDIFAIVQLPYKKSYDRRKAIMRVLCLPDTVQMKTIYESLYFAQRRVKQHRVFMEHGNLIQYPECHSGSSGRSDAPQRACCTERRKLTEEINSKIPDSLISSEGSGLTNQPTTSTQGTKEALRKLIDSAYFSEGSTDMLFRLRSVGVQRVQDLLIMDQVWEEAVAAMKLKIVDKQKLKNIIDRIKASPNSATVASTPSVAKIYDSANIHCPPAASCLSRAVSLRDQEQAFATTTGCLHPASQVLLPPPPPPPVAKLATAADSSAEPEGRSAATTAATTTAAAATIFRRGEGKGNKSMSRPVRPQAVRLLPPPSSPCAECVAIQPAADQDSAAHRGLAEAGDGFAEVRKAGLAGGMETAKRLGGTSLEGVDEAGAFRRVRRRLMAAGCAAGPA